MRDTTTITITVKSAARQRGMFATRLGGRLLVAHRMNLCSPPRGR